MSVSKGNAGEHLVMAELLSRELDAYWADRGNPAFDIACFWNPSGRAIRLRVKTTSDGGAVWTAKKKGLFLDVQNENDLVVICDLRGGIRGANVYIVPTPIVEKHLIDNHEHCCSMPGRNGKRRDATTDFRILRFFGEPRQDDRSWGYHLAFEEYRDAWSLLQ